MGWYPPTLVIETVKSFVVLAFGDRERKSLPREIILLPGMRITFLRSWRKLTRGGVQVFNCKLGCFAPKKFVR